MRKLIAGMKTSLDGKIEGTGKRIRQLPIRDQLTV